MQLEDITQTQEEEYNRNIFGNHIKYTKNMLDMCVNFVEKNFRENCIVNNKLNKFLYMKTEYHQVNK